MVAHEAAGEGLDQAAGAVDRGAVTELGGTRVERYRDPEVALLADLDVHAGGRWQRSSRPVSRSSSCSSGPGVYSTARSPAVVISNGAPAAANRSAHRFPV